MQKLYSRDIEAYKKMKLDHLIRNLAYGDYAEKFQSVLKKYPSDFKEFIHPWKPITKKAPATQKADYEYHLNILPSQFYDQGIKQSRTYYKFSINEAEMVRQSSLYPV